MTQPARLVRRVLVAPFQQFVDTGSLGGIVLLVCTVLALAWANSPWSEDYLHLWELKLAVGPAAAPMSLTLHHWINDGLMTIFFLLVGLEIKRELLVGELASPRQAALPIFAAIGGMVVPATLFLLFNAGGEGSAGWGIPMATDIAFALGIATLLGPRVPVGLKVFLAALAIVDDLGAVLVIALFYTSALDIGALLAAAGALALLVSFNRLHLMKLTPYLLVGAAMWYFLLQSGIHATIAGVVLALTVPARTRTNTKEFSDAARKILDEFDHAETGDLLVITSPGQREALYALDVAASNVNAPLLRLERGLHSLVAFLVMPLFAFSNAGVPLADSLDALARPVVWGIVVGLVLGKALGISLFSWLAVELGFAALPAGVSWRALRGVACLGGIGFTMSLFIANLAFPEAALLEQSKIGILIASTVSGTLAVLLLRRT